MAFGAKIQSTQKDAGAVSSTTLAFTSSNTAGNILVAALRVGSTTETLTNNKITDSQGNVWSVKKSQDQTTDGHKLWVLVAFNSNAGANTVTIAKSGTGTLRFVIAEYTATSTSDTTDQTNSGQGTTQLTMTAGNVTTTVASELLLAAFSNAADSNSFSMTAGSGYAVDEQVTTSSRFRVGIEHRVVSSTGTYAGDATLNGDTPDNWAAAIVTLAEISAVALPSGKIYQRTYRPRPFAPGIAR